MCQVNHWIRFVLACATVLMTSLAHASMGLTEIEGETEGGLVTVFYSSSSPAEQIERGAFLLNVAWKGLPERGNGRLIVISHGSPASPWVYADLARALVESGFIVAMPEHFRDNYKDDSEPGPPSWKRRPQEVSRAIDIIRQDARFAPLVTVNRVGVFGMSAGGHTALTLAGGRWSPSRLKEHCEIHLADDFHACAGLTSRLNDGIFDGLKMRIVKWVNGRKLDDQTWYAHTDPRVAAVVAGVPFAVDFDMASLSAPRMPLGIIGAQADKWLIPKFHSNRIIQACSSCELLVDMKEGGHGALLSPLPPERSGLIADLIDDPPGFDRARMVPEINRKIVAFFLKNLLVQEPARMSANPSPRQTVSSH